MESKRLDMLVAEYPRLEYPRGSVAAWLHIARLLVAVYLIRSEIGYFTVNYKYNHNNFLISE